MEKKFFESVSKDHATESDHWIVDESGNTIWLREIQLPEPIAEEDATLAAEDFFSENNGGKLSVYTAFIAGFKSAQANRFSDECDHEIVDARNEVVQSGYMCIKCNKLFKAYAH